MAIPGRERLRLCIQCGTCGGSCPSGDAMDHTPRELFAMILAGMRAGATEACPCPIAGATP